jgi:hypothetical protein
MKAMARQRSHSIEFKRQVAQEFIAGESLYALSKRHDISRQLIRVWVEKYEAGGLDEHAQAADLLQEYIGKTTPLADLSPHFISPPFAFPVFRQLARVTPVPCRSSLNECAWTSEAKVDTFQSVSLFHIRDLGARAPIATKAWS